MKIAKMLLGVFVFSFALSVADDVSGQRRGGGGRGGGRGGGGFSRGGARSSVHSRPSSRAGMHRGGGGYSRPSQLPSRPNVDRGRPNTPSRPNVDYGRTNIGSGNRVNRDVDINRPINIGDVDVNGNGYYGRWGGCCHYEHPVARAAVGTAAVAGAAYAGAAAANSYYGSSYYGSTVYALPSGCTTVYVNGVTYEECGGTYYQPQFYGTSTQYIVVSPPR